MDMRDMRDGRNPYGSRGGYVTSSRGGRGRGRGRGRRGDRGMPMDYWYDMRDMRRGDYEGEDMRRGGRRDYGDMRGDYGYSPDMEVGRQTNVPSTDMRGGYDRGYDRAYDGHFGRQGEYEPVEFMGYCSGYYGPPKGRGDYGRGRGRDYGYDMRGRRDYGDYGDYRDYGDYGETLSTEEMDHWCKKLKEELNDQEKQMFSKEMISQKARQMGKPMEGFGEKELEVTTLMIYTDYKNTIGQNPDMAIKLAFDWLTDKDVAVKGAEKLAVYYDSIVEGE